jgi:nucleoid DNA-binding protein
MAEFNIKAFLIKKIALSNDTNHHVSEKDINAIITHQFDSANEAVKTVNSVEFSGFGKLYFNVNKAFLRMEKIEKAIEHYSRIIEDQTTSPTVRRNSEMKLASNINMRNNLKPKIDASNTRRLEK